MPLLIVAIACLIAGSCMAQNEQTTLKKRLSFATERADNFLNVQNINGDVTIIGHDKNTIEVEVLRTITGRTTSSKQQGNEEVQLGVIQKDGIIVLFMDHPCTNQEVYQLNSEQLRSGKFNQWINNCKWNPPYDYRMDWTVKVPKNTMLFGSTINEGDLTIRNMSNFVDANNINGDITLSDLGGKTKVNAINGEVLINYNRNPTESCEYYSLNGNIKATFVKGLSAKVFFESFNGDFYTEIDDVRPMPMKVRKEKVNKEKGIKYKLNGNPGVQVRGGEVELYFETFNANVYLLEQ